MGKTKQAFITINGKKYDARTGQLVTPSTAVVKSTAKKPTAKPRTTKTTLATTARPKTVSDVSRTPATSIKRRQTARSQTLMRSAVKKPAPIPKPRTAKAPLQAATTPQKPNLPRIQHFDIARHSRAVAVKKSELVSKFNSSPLIQNPIAAAQAVVSEHIEQLPINPAPAVQAATTQVQSILEKGLKSAQSHTEIFKPASTTSAKRSKGKKSATTTGKKNKKRLISLAAGSLSAVLLIGFIAFQNIANISVRYAVARSGVQASLPGYKPAGFALSNKIQYNPGQITLNFSSNSDNRAFKITQRDTVWNSESLLSNYVQSQSDQIQKYEDKGRTIFIYGSNNATWVNGGIWYDVSGESHLNSDQLIRIATSM